MSDDLKLAMEKVASRRDEGGRVLKCLSLEAVGRLAAEFGLLTREVSVFALENGYTPLKYVKNIGTVGLDGQARLLSSRVVVVGAGGIGGHATSLLARMGVGTIVLVDKDVFDETNLNRQCFATEKVVGEPKVETAGRCIAEINRDVEVVTKRLAADGGNLAGLVEGADAVIDALDTINDRLILQEACGKQGVVMVHGAIAGTCLQVTTIFPGDPGLERLVPETGSAASTGESIRGIEVETGNPATTPALAAGFQVAEAVKVIVGRGEPLRNRMLFLDIDDWTIDFVELA